MHNDPVRARRQRNRSSVRCVRSVPAEIYLWPGLDGPISLRDKADDSGDTLPGSTANGVWRLGPRLEESEMAIGVTWRAFTTTLVCMGFSVFFAALGCGAAFTVRSTCLGLGFRWGFLGEDGGIAVFFIVFVLGGVTLGVIVGKKLCCPQHRISWCGAAAAFLCGGVAGIGIPFAMDILGVWRADREALELPLVFLVAVPLSSVLGYDLVAWTVSKLCGPQMLLEKSPSD